MVSIALLVGGSKSPLESESESESGWKGKSMGIGHEKLHAYRAAIEYVGWAYRYCKVSRIGCDQQALPDKSLSIPMPTPTAMRAREGHDRQPCFAQGSKGRRIFSECLRYEHFLLSHPILVAGDAGGRDAIEWPLGRSSTITSWFNIGFRFRLPLCYQELIFYLRENFFFFCYSGE
jgi:hypothetical protein